MIYFPFKRLIGMVGIPRSGKDTVAKFLEENYGFKRMAFADKIKEEFGLDHLRFKELKKSGQDAVVRKELWQFSAKKKKSDPLYFIKKVMKDFEDGEKSVVITDIRTYDEWNAVEAVDGAKIFMITRGNWGDQFVDGRLAETDFLKTFLWDKLGRHKRIIVSKYGKFDLYKKIERKMFFEDFRELAKKDSNFFKLERYFEQYLVQSKQQYEDFIRY